MSDEQLNGQYRGWADRVADGLAKKSPTFTYSNLAVRGKLLQQVIDDIHHGSRYLGLISCRGK
jgi:hypothetical protein